MMGPNIAETAKKATAAVLVAIGFVLGIAVIAFLSVATGISPLVAL